MGNCFILCNTHDPGLADGCEPGLADGCDPGLADGFCTLAILCGFSVHASLSFSKEQGPPLHRKNTYIQRNEDSGRRMSSLEAAQTAWQLNLLV